MPDITVRSDYEHVTGHDRPDDSTVAYVDDPLEDRRARQVKVIRPARRPAPAASPVTPETKG